MARKGMQVDRPLSDWLDTDGQPILVTVLVCEDGTAWYPINNLCRAFWVDARYWQERMREADAYDELLDQFEVNTAGGKQEMWCVEREGVPLLLAFMGMSRKVNPTAKKRILPFQRFLIKLAALAFRGEVNDLSDVRAVAEQSRSLAVMPGGGTDRRLSNLEGYARLTHERLSAVENGIAELRRLLAE